MGLEIGEVSIGIELEGVFLYAHNYVVFVHHETIHKAAEINCTALKYFSSLYFSFLFLSLCERLYCSKKLQPILFYRMYSQGYSKLL